MVQFTSKIIDPIGLHARPAALMVNAASTFKSDIKIIANNREGNVKSIMNIMALAIMNNQEFTLVAKGPDEDEALDKIKVVMQKNKLIDGIN